MSTQGSNMLAQVIAQKIMAAQKDIIAAAAKNNIDIHEIAEMLSQHIPAHEGRLDVERELIENLEALQRSRKKSM